MSSEAQRETHSFQAEVNQLLDLVIHSLYSNREIFLRELISNASDALDRLRFGAITEPGLLAGDAALEIRLIPDEAAGTLTVEDTGVGMSKDELVRDLGTIARSGSRAFLEQLKERGGADLKLIGQFGVGFYSAYLVADRVEVVSRAAGADEAFRWTSNAKDGFTVEPDARATRGTQITLHLKSDQREYLQPWRLKELVARYSDYVSHPILLKTGKDGGFEKTNRASALWQRPKAEITQAQYDEFYQHLAHAFEPPLAQTHFTAEGAQQFTALLFVPKHRPLELEGQSKRGVRLFVKRVFILDNVEELLPPWLRFVRGVVDSDDLPLNVSRELLQDSSVVRTIKRQLTKKVLDLLDKLAKDKPDDYEVFWQAFGSVLKEGLVVDAEYREKIAALARYATSHGDKLTSLADYVTRMPAEQEAIYYAFGESAPALLGSPYLEALRQHGFEVLLMTDPVDDLAAQAVREFSGKKLVSAMQADLKLKESEEEKTAAEQRSSELRPLLDAMQEVLKDKVREVRPSARLTDSPCCLVLPEGGTPAYLERLLREHGKGLPATKRIFEVNPNHAVIQGLKAIHGREAASAKLRDWTELLYEQALLSEGSPLEDPNRFARRITALLTEAAAAAAS